MLKISYKFDTKFDILRNDTHLYILYVSNFQNVSNPTLIMMRRGGNRVATRDITFDHRPTHPRWFPGSGHRAEWMDKFAFKRLASFITNVFSRKSIFVVKSKMCFYIFLIFENKRKKVKRSWRRRKRQKWSISILVLIYILK